MWRPDEVVSQHKRRAIMLWLALVLAIIAYASFLLYKAGEKMKNPGTSFKLSNDLYVYPDVYVCLYNFFGCDSLELEENCLNSVNSTEGGDTAAFFNPLGVNEAIASHASLTDERGWCVTFDSSSSFEIGTRQERDPEDFILLNMYWYPGGAANNSTTCIQEDGGWNDHSESVFVFLRDADSSVLSAGIQVSYSCITNESSSHTFTYMGIGLTEENKISGKNTASYEALETSSSVYKDKRDANITGITAPYAWLSMEIAQVPNSLRTITEIDPLEIAEIFGNIGGFWDLLLLFWPIFFVSAATRDPQLRGRDFRKTVARGTQHVRKAAPTTVFPLVRSEKRTRILDSREEKEQGPAWETFSTPSRQQERARKFVAGRGTGNRQQQQPPLFPVRANTRSSSPSSQHPEDCHCV